jgi:hypothetical protein
VLQIKERLNNQLRIWQKKLNSRDIKWCHTRQRFQLDVPTALVEGTKKP